MKEGSGQVVMVEDRKHGFGQQNEIRRQMTDRETPVRQVVAAGAARTAVMPNGDPPDVTLWGADG